MIYLQLFLSFFKIGLFGFGGGLAILSLIQMEVEEHGWMSQQEFVDIVAVSQVTPGPIGINCATYVGYTATGTVWGSLLSTFAIILPSLIIMLTLCKVYFWLSTRFQGNPYFEQTLRMLRFTVIGLVASAALMLIKPTNFIDTTSWIIFATVCMLTVLPQMVKNKVTEIISHPILLIVAAGIAGYLIYS
jgi:chromate transporter